MVILFERPQRYQLRFAVIGGLKIFRYMLIIQPEKEYGSMRKTKLLKFFITYTALTLSCLSMVHAEVSQEPLKSLSIPDKVETSIGTLDFLTESLPMPLSTKSMTTSTALAASAAIWIILGASQSMPFSMALPQRVPMRLTKSLCSSN